MESFLIPQQIPARGPILGRRYYEEGKWKYYQVPKLRPLLKSAEGSRSPPLRSSTAVSDKRFRRVCAGACARAACAWTYQWLLPCLVAEAPCLSGGWWAVMGNLYQYAMRKSSLSGCQTCHRQSSGSVRGTLA